MKKQIGFIGLGRMGENMVLNLSEKGWRVVVYNRSPGKTKKISRKKNIIASYDLGEFMKKLPRPRVIWIMIPAGKHVDIVIQKLSPYLSKGDIIIDGGNSFYEISMKRAMKLKSKGIHFLDVGVSGGIEGARSGSSLMIGGEEKVFKKIEPLFKSLSVKDGYGYMGSSGAGRFVKGIHNGIEYGMMASLNEGFEAIRKSQEKFKTDLKTVSRVYANGSILEGRLTNWLWESFQEPKYLDNISCEVPKGETEKEMKILEKRFDMKILKQARLMRVHSRKKGICGQIISTLRNKFGGHETKKLK